MPRILALALAAVLGLTACAAPIRGPVAVPGTVSPQVDRLSAAPAVFEPLTPEGRAARAAARTFVEVVGRVEPVAEAMCRERNPRAFCDFRIVVDDRPGMPPNAFQTLDSRGQPVLAFTLALIAEVRNADELAFVMAHEAGHHILGHLDRQRLNADLGAEVFGQLAGAVGGGTVEEIRAAQQLGAAVGARSYSREFELEADALGTVIAARAGFNPLIGSEFFFRLPDPGNRFLGTHPSNAERLATVERIAADLGFTR